MHIIIFVNKAMKHIVFFINNNSKPYACLMALLPKITIYILQVRAKKQQHYIKATNEINVFSFDKDCTFCWKMNWYIEEKWSSVALSYFQSENIITYNYLSCIYSAWLEKVVHTRLCWCLSSSVLCVKSGKLHGSHLNSPWDTQVAGVEAEGRHTCR